MSSNPKYPNLELIEDIFRQHLEANESWKKKLEEIRENSGFPHLYQPDFEVEVFLQVWESTCTAFDEREDGSFDIGRLVATKAYTVVIEEMLTKTFGVFVDGRLCYMVDKPSEVFCYDLTVREMKSLSVARKRY